MFTGVCRSAHDDDAFRKNLGTWKTLLKKHKFGLTIEDQIKARMCTPFFRDLAPDINQLPAP